MKNLYNNLAVILFDKKCKFLNQKKINDYEYYIKILPENKKLYFLDFTKYYLGKINFTEFKYKNQRVEYIKIDNIKQISKLIEGIGNFYAIGPVSCTFNTFLIFLLIKFFRFKLIFISSFGYYSNNFDVDPHFYLKNLKVLFNRLSYFLFRVFSILNIIPSIEYYFESSALRIKNIEDSISRKIEKKVKFLKLSYFQKYIRINSIYYDQINFCSINKNKKFLMLLDSGLDHPDNNIYSSKKDLLFLEKNRKNYYRNLFNFLDYLKKDKNKKIVFSKHPKNIYPDYVEKFLEKNYILMPAHEAIFNAEIVFFTGGSTMLNKCIILEKDFYFLMSKYRSSYNLKNINSYKKQLHYIPEIQLENFKNFENIKKYDFSSKSNQEFVNDNLIFHKNEKSYETIKRYLF